MLSIADVVLQGVASHAIPEVNSSGYQLDLSEVPLPLLPVLTESDLKQIPRSKPLLAPEMRAYRERKCPACRCCRTRSCRS